MRLGVSNVCKERQIDYTYRSRTNIHNHLMLKLLVHSYMIASDDDSVFVDLAWVYYQCRFCCLQMRQKDCRLGLSLRTRTVGFLSPWWTLAQQYSTCDQDSWRPYNLMANGCNVSIVSDSVQLLLRFFLSRFIASWWLQGTWGEWGATIERL